jgi:dipeptidase E
MSLCADMLRRLLLISTSTVHGSRYLDYCADDIVGFLRDRLRVLFIPFARPSGISLADYSKRARERFATMGFELNGIEAATDPREAVETADVIFIGGGNTFLLLRDLYETGLIEPIRERVANGVPYIGTSAGSNVAGLTIGTTNDMPIVRPSTFDALGLVPFNINPHYLDPDPDSKHKGETRETRIKEYHVLNPQPVVGLREGAWLEISGDSMLLGGSSGARLFRQGSEPEEFETGDQLDFLLSSSR